MSSEEEVARGIVSKKVADFEVTYPDATESYRTEFDHERRSPSEAVVMAVATVRDEDPLELPPLASFVDPDALNEFLVSAVSGERRVESAVTFQYANHFVTLNGHGTVIVESTGK